MPAFAVHYTYSEATVPGRDTYRAEHRSWLGELVEQGTLLTCGPYPDGSGALLIFRFESAEKLSALLGEDPFARERLIDDIRVVEWSPTLGAFVP